MIYEIITDEKGFTYGVVKYAKTITTLYTSESIRMFSTVSENFNDVVYHLQESNYVFFSTSRIEFEQVKRKLGYIEDRHLSNTLLSKI